MLKMYRLVVLLTAVLLLQFTSCRVRDQRHIPNKFDYIVKLVPVLTQEVKDVNTRNQVEKESIQFAAEIYVKEATLVANFFIHGIQNNTKDNEQGRGLQVFLLSVSGFVQFLQGALQKDDIQLQQNLLGAVQNFLGFIPTTKEILASAKESSVNSELTINSLTGAIDTALALFPKMKTIIENKRASNSELQNKIKQSLPETYDFLGQISSKKYNIRELFGHSRQLKYLVRELAADAKNLLKITPLQSEFKTAIEEAIKRLGIIENEIQSKVHSKIAISPLQNYYRGWLSEISKITDDLDNEAKDMAAVKRVILDALGIIEFYRIAFGILAGKIL